MTWRQQALEHAIKSVPNESVGLVAIVKGKEKYWPCKNIAADPTLHFIIDPDDYMQCEDENEVMGIVHSHPKGGPPSQTDLDSCEFLDLPFYICDPIKKTWHDFKPSGYKPNALIGRKWVWNVQDCWTLIDDWFRIEKGIKFQTWERPKSLKAFQENPLFEYGLPLTGFIELKDTEELQYGDVLLVNDNLDHVALYIGNQEILHHCVRQLSCRELYDENRINLTKRRYRHASTY